MLLSYIVEFGSTRFPLENGNELPETQTQAIIKTNFGGHASVCPPTGFIEISSRPRK
jgi:hypothetical protein